MVDYGDAKNEVDPGDWAILKVEVPVTLPPLRPDLDYEFEFGDAIVRMGNDYSKGIIAATGYVGQKSQGLVTCLTDGHPGVSGGGVLNQRGDLVGIPVGRLQGDYRFSFILPLRREMFRRVGHATVQMASVADRRLTAPSCRAHDARYALPSRMRALLRVPRIEPALDLLLESALRRLGRTSCPAAMPAGSPCR